VEEKEIRALELSLEQLRQSLAELGGGRDIEELILIIHGPGYTTAVEHYFVAGITDSLTQQVQNVTWLKNLLIEGTRVIGEPDVTGKKTTSPRLRLRSGPAVPPSLERDLAEESANRGDPGNRRARRHRKNPAPPPAPPIRTCDSTSFGAQ
jgi:hypothetical protein